MFVCVRNTKLSSGESLLARAVNIAIESDKNSKLGVFLADRTLCSFSHAHCNLSCVARPYKGLATQDYTAIADCATLIHSLTNTTIWETDTQKTNLQPPIL